MSEEQEFYGDEIAMKQPDAITPPVIPASVGQVDEDTAEAFGAIGYDKANLPPKLIELHNQYKLYHDRLRPGRLTVGDFATIALLASLYQAGPET